MLNLIAKILKVFDDNGLWDDGVELIGSWCFFLYQKHLGVNAFPFRTVDIDFLIPFPFKSSKKINLRALLEPLGFQTAFNSDGSVYLWSSELKIEFLTVEIGRGSESAKEIKPLSLNAIPLRFMNILLKNPILIEEKGIKVSLPNPAAFGLHKLLIAGRRKNPAKRLKDLEQALLTLEVVANEKIINLYKPFPKPWKKNIITMLEKSADLLPLRQHLVQRLFPMLQQNR